MRKGFGLAGCLAMGLVLGALASTAVTGPIQAAAPIKAASATQGLSVGPLLLATTDKLFGDNGVNIDWRFLPNQGPTMAALLSDEIQVGVIGCQGVFDANLAGKDLRVIAGISTANSVLILRSDVAAKLKVGPDAPVQARLQALRGLKLATSPVASTNYAYLSSYLAAAGLDPKKDVTILPAPEPSALLAGVRAGKFDGAAYGPGALEPLLADKSGVLWVSLARGDVPALKDSLFMCVAAKKAFVDANPEAVKGIQATLAKATRLMQDPATAEKSRATIKKGFFSAMDEQLYSLSYAAALPAYLPSLITPRGYDSLMQIQSAVTGKNYSSVKYAETVVDGAKAK